MNNMKKVKLFFIKYAVSEKIYWKIKNIFNQQSKFHKIFSSFNFNGSVYQIRENIKFNHSYEGEFLDLFTDKNEYQVTKWHHYLPLYEKYLMPYKNKSVKMLEIGVDDGGGLSLFKKFLGEKSKIYGIDIKSPPKEIHRNVGKVFIGSQDDTKFLQKVFDKVGKIDILIDDGSHVINHIKTTMEFSLKYINDGGIYIVEDLHTNYFRFWNNNKFVSHDFFQFIKEIIDDIHVDFHNKELNHPEVSKYVNSVYIHNSFVAFTINPKTKLDWSRI
jgi:hypothetical protein